MGTVKKYPQIIQTVLNEYAGNPSHGDIRAEVIVDRDQKHFELMHVGWDGTRRVHGTVLHLDIIDGKIWIQHDGTAPGIALDLVAAGVPREEIVLAFRPADVRQYTGYAVS